MFRYWQIRLFGLVVAALSAALIYYNWQQLATEGTYSFRLAALPPIGVVLGIYIFFFPTKIGRPETALDKFLVFVLLIIGFAAGSYNWYLMDPAKFVELWQVIRAAF